MKIDDKVFSIKEKTFDKILNYAHYAKDKFKSEIGGMCVVLKDEDGDYELVDPVILKQTISGGQCELDKDELAEYYTKADKKYYKEKYSFCWWHSHHTLGAFWSNTDTNTMEEASGSQISYSLVVSWDKEEYGHIFRISLWEPYVDAKDIQLEITDRKQKKIPKSIVKEVDEKCSETRTVSNYIGSPINRNYRSYNSYGIPGLNSGYQRSLFEHRVDTISKEKEIQEIDTVADYGMLIDLVDKLIKKLVDGTINYTLYSYEIDKINERLDDTPLSVKKEHIKKIDNLLTNTAGDYIEYDLTHEDIDDLEMINTIEGDWI